MCSMRVCVYVFVQHNRTCVAGLMIYYHWTCFAGARNDDNVDDDDVDMCVFYMYVMMCAAQNDII